MNVSIVFILVGLIVVVNSYRRLIYHYLYQNQNFTYQNGPTAYQFSGNFLLPSTQTTSNFISCTTPPTSYITLNNIYSSAQSNQTQLLSKWCFLSMDLYFHGTIKYNSIINTWTSQTTTISFNIFSYLYDYTSPLNYQMTTGFCDDIAYDVKTLNFTFQIPTLAYGNLQFTSSNINDGQVSIRNIHISDPQFLCYQLCKSCSGENYNQCLSCYNGLPTNNICPPCPSNQYFEKKYGCRDICDIYLSLYSKGFCNNYPIYKFYDTIMQLDYKKNLWLIIYDPKHVDTSPTLIGTETYGVFKFNSGIYRFFDFVSLDFPGTYLIGLKIRIITFNNTPVNCGIQFMITETFKFNISLFRTYDLILVQLSIKQIQNLSSIFTDATGIQTHNLKIFYTAQVTEYLPYTLSTLFDLIMYVDIPKFPFLFSARGNYTEDTAGWGLQFAKVTSGYCPENCQLCEVQKHYFVLIISFKCKTCKNGYYKYKDNIVELFLVLIYVHLKL